MKLIRLEMVNFKKFRHAEIEFQDGLTGIIGNNGAGKSTIVEAILWSLYGNNKGVGIKKDFLKNNNAAESDPMSVKLVLDKGNQVWSIYRGMKANGQTEALLKINNKRMAWSVKDMDDYLTKELHTSAQDFKKTFYARQKDLDNLLKDGGADKKEYLLKLLNLSDIKPRYIELIKADINENEGKKNWLDHALRDIGDVGLKQEEILANISKGEAELDKLGKYNNELVDAVNKCEMDCEMHSRKEQSHKYLAEAISKQESSLSNKRDSLKSEDGKLAEIDNHKKRLTDIEPALERYSLIKSRLDALEPLKSNYENILRRQEVTNKQIEGIERQLKERQERLSALQKDKVHSESLKPNEDEYIRLKNEIPEWDKIRDNYNGISSKSNEEKINLSSIESRIPKLEKNLDDLITANAMFCSIKPLKSDYESLQEEFSALTIQKDERSLIEEQSKRRDNLAEQIGKLSGNENDLLHELSQFSDLGAKESQLVAQEMDLQAQDEKISEDRIRLNRASSVFQSKEIEAKEHLERVRGLGADGTCPTCERPLGGQHEVLCSKYEHEISEAERMGEGLEAEIRSLNERTEINSRAKTDLKKAFEILHQDKTNIECDSRPENRDSD
jgi:exonuclease SbcC